MIAMIVVIVHGRGEWRRRCAPPILDRLLSLFFYSRPQTAMQSDLAPPIQTGAPYPKILAPPLCVGGGGGGCVGVCVVHAFVRDWDRCTYK